MKLVERYNLTNNVKVTMGDEKLLQYFPNAWAEKKWLDFAVDMMCQLQDYFTKHNIEWMLIGGTLLGAVRHGGIIPWDDDIDISVLSTNSNKIIDKEMMNNFSDFNFIKEISSRDGIYYKICPKNGEKIIRSRNDLYWPFIDIFFHINENEQTKFSTPGFVLSKEDVYPIQQTEFEGQQFPIMHNPYDQYLNFMYPGWKEWCVSNDWCHRKECSINPVVKVPIDKLRKYYRFLI